MKKKWLLLSVSGLLLIGLGESFIGEAIILKYKKSEKWFLLGTIGLIVLNSGICLFGQAIIEKIKK